MTERRPVWTRSIDSGQARIGRCMHGRRSPPILYPAVSSLTFGANRSGVNMSAGLLIPCAVLLSIWSIRLAKHALRCVLAWAGSLTDARVQHTRTRPDETSFQPETLGCSTIWARAAYGHPLVIWYPSTIGHFSFKLPYSRFSKFSGNVSHKSIHMIIIGDILMINTFE